MCGIAHLKYGFPSAVLACALRIDDARKFARPSAKPVQRRSFGYTG